MKWLSSILFTCFISSTTLACLPSKSEFDSTFFSCKSDTDCLLVKEGCRSCGTSQIAVNKSKLIAFQELDTKLRVNKNCMIACEACSQQQTKVKCVKKTCEALP